MHVDVNVILNVQTRVDELDRLSFIYTERKRIFSLMFAAAPV